MPDGGPRELAEPSNPLVCGFAVVEGQADGGLSSIRDGIALACTLQLSERWAAEKHCDCVEKF